MVVLVIDDQTSVVSGIISSINWSGIGVTKVLKAYNAFEAKDIFSRQTVDIMLCDIEMPVEDGLSLFRWVKEEGYSAECIFLTAHADFIYAKEAIRLGSFDYIVQPAWFEDIQNALLRAINKVKSKKEYQEYYTYGKLWVQKKDILLEGILKDWFLGEPIKLDYLMNDFQKINIPLNQTSLFHFAIIHMTRWNNEMPNWNDKLFRYALTNMVSEIFGNYGQNILLIHLDTNRYGFITYSEENICMELEAVERQLDYLIYICKEYFHCSIACYTGMPIKMNELTQRVADLNQLRENNVALFSKVFIFSGKPVKKEEQYNIPNMKRWTDLLIHNSTQVVKEEIYHYLYSQSAKGLLDAEALQRFYQEFMHILFNVSEILKVSFQDVFNNQEALKKSLSSYNSVDEMKELIDYVINYFESKTKSPEFAENQIGKIIQYIHDNIEKDIRRSDLVESVFLSPDYISRLFSQKVGMPLSEFVMIEKMKVAQTLLQTTSLPINVIAVKVGYSNFSYFSKIYKKVFGVTPATDRQNKV